MDVSAKILILVVQETKVLNLDNQWQAETSSRTNILYSYSEGMKMSKL